MSWGAWDFMDFIGGFSWVIPTRKRVEKQDLVPETPGFAEA